jgi:peptidoglycan/xylan/chitin deacetylase (PgdA/CDA1 family)
MNAKPDVPRLTVLAYHKIGTPPAGSRSCYYVPDDLFIQQLEVLGAEGWTVIDSETFLAALDSPERMPQKAALLTFDDGCQSVVRIALPILKRFCYPAVCFVPTDFIGRGNTFDAGVEPEEPICDWEELRELESGGVAVESHGVSHGYLSLMSREGQEREVTASKRVIEQRLAKTVRLFAYPYSDCGKDENVMSRCLERACYRAAFLCGDVAVEPLPIRHPYLINRLAMFPGTDLRAALS